MTEIEKVLYTAKTHTLGGREDGGSRSSDGRLDVKFLSPGTAGSGTNPEQLFAAGWSACFISAMKDHDVIAVFNDFVSLRHGFFPEMPEQRSVPRQGR
jgi:hypothetical protein